MHFIVYFNPITIKCNKMIVTDQKFKPCVGLCYLNYSKLAWINMFTAISLPENILRDRLPLNCWLGLTDSYGFNHPKLKFHQRYRRSQVWLESDVLSRTTPNWSDTDHFTRCYSAPTCCDWEESYAKKMRRCSGSIEQAIKHDDVMWCGRSDNDQDDVEDYTLAV